MSQDMRESLKRIAGETGQAEDGVPRVAPRSTEEAAALLGLAHAQGWRVRLEGAGTWMPPDAPADFALTTTRMRRVVSLSATDLVATVQAGLSLAELESSLAAHGAWLALDPPGLRERTLGSILATATAGPLGQRFGPVRDHVLGATVVAGDGRVVRAGGTVVKNVAGYDLTKLQVGGFGAFGLIAEVHLRLRAAPEIAVALAARGTMDELLDGAARLTAAGIEPAGLELASPGLTGARDWTLLAQFVGTRAGVDASVAELTAAGLPIGFATLDRGGTTDPVRSLARAALEGPVTLRLGALPESMADTVELVAESLGVERVSAGLIRGGVRWTGAASDDRLIALRSRLAEREIPLTLEWAPWPLRSRVGHFGAFREGVGTLTGRLRGVFDPRGILMVPAEGSPRG
jgi:FAD/FMN-containing dehydrogenase